MRRVAALGARRRHRMRSGSGGSVAGARLRYVHVAAHDVAGVNSLLAATGGDAFAAPSLVARSAGRRGARRVERDGCARRARRPLRGAEVDGRSDGDDVAERRRVRRARRDRALRRRRDEVLAGMLAPRSDAVAVRARPARHRTNDLRRRGARTPARSARRERAESARAHGLRPADLRARPPVRVRFGEGSYSATRARDGRNARARRLGVPGVA